MAYTLEQLGQVFRNTMLNILLGGDGSLPPPKDSFITWCQPGLPYTADDLNFTTNLGSAPDAETQNKIFENAFNFATQVDFIPDPTMAYTNDKQQGVYRNEAGIRLSEIYSQILRFSKVVDTPLSDDEKAKIERFKGLLRVTQTVPDIITGEPKEVTSDGPMVKAYKEKQQAYLQAALAYNIKRVAALTATGPDGKAASMDWALNAQLYKMAVDSAAGDWEANGYKNELEEVEAYINQVTQRSMVLWKQSLLNLMEPTLRITAPSGPFYLTTYTPGDFATASGWTGYSMYHSMVDSSSHTESTSWSAGGSVWYGFWHAGASVSEQSSNYSSSFAIDDFRLSFEMSQVQLVRPWFSPEFLINRGWDLRQGEGWNFDKMPSDGGAPPSGLFVGYPLQAIFVRNVSITSAGFKQAYDAYSSQFSGSGSVGWGPITLSGSYGHSESGNHFHSEGDGATITVPGMQIIAFVNHLFGKTPNLLPDIDQSKLV